MADYQQLVNNFMKNKSLSFHLRNTAVDSKKSIEPLPRKSNPVVEPEEPEAKKRCKPSENGVFEGAVAAALSRPRSCAKAENVQPAEPNNSVSALAQGLCQQIHAAATQRKKQIHTMVHGIVKDFNGHVIKTLETEEELKKKKLANIVNGLREATDGALKLRASLADQTNKFSKAMEDHLKYLEVMKQCEEMNVKRMQSTLESISVEIKNLETGRSKNIYAEQTKPLIEKIDAMIDKFQLDHVKQIIDHQKKFLE